MKLLLQNAYSWSGLILKGSIEVKYFYIKQSKSLKERRKKMNTPYSILGIPTNSTDEQIKTAFRSLAKATHPDANSGDTSRINQFREVAEAYAILSDPVSKYAVDESLKEGQKVKDWGKYSGFKSAKATARDIENYIHQMYEEVRPFKEAATRSAFIGLAWLIGGLIIFFMSYSAAAQTGGSYIVPYGAIIFGGIQAVRSFYRYSQINNALSETETMIWKQFRDWI